MSQRTDAYVFDNLGYLGVGIFFFLSAYGLCNSYEKKGNRYAKEILYKKIPNLILVMIITIWISIIYFELTKQKIDGIEEVVFALKGNRLLNWYFSAQIILYLLFILNMKFDGYITNYFCLRLGFFTVILIGILMLLYIKGIVGIHWFISLLCFPMGAKFYYMFKDNDKFIKILRNKKICIVNLIAVLIMVIMVHYFYFWNYCIGLKIIEIIMRFCIPIFFSINYTMLLSEYSSRYIFRWIGKRSAEMILVQQIALDICKNNIENGLLYVILSIIFTIILAALMYPFYNKMKIMLRKRNCL